jgi:hypothetical protein
VRAGLFQPDRSPPAESLAAFREQISYHRRAQAIAPEEIESFIGRDMMFSVPAMDSESPFTAENFLLSFSLPNFYFHATTAYDLLRHLGAPIGKMDFLGQPCGSKCRHERSREIPLRRAAGGGAGALSERRWRARRWRSCCMNFISTGSARRSRT